MKDVTSRFTTRDCSTPSCPYEADAQDGLCRHCRRMLTWGGKLRLERRRKAA